MNAADMIEHRCSARGRLHQLSVYCNGSQNGPNCALELLQKMLHFDPNMRYDDIVILSMGDL